MHARGLIEMLALAGLPLFSGCNTGKASLDWGGKEDDARLIADVYTWPCEVLDSKTGGATTWQGVFAQTVSLQFAPDDLPTMTLPSPGGCSASLDMFPDDAGAGAENLPDVDEPTWETDVDDGTLDSLSTGFWMDDVFHDVHGCQYVDAVLAGGTRLSDAGILEGISTPIPKTAPEVEFNGELAGTTTHFDWGEEIDLAWETHDWDESWVQVRRVREGEAWEAVTCNVTGMTGFTVDSDVWALMDEDLEVDQNNIYVGFQNASDEIGEDSAKVETLTRTIAVAVVAD